MTTYASKLVFTDPTDQMTDLIEYKLSIFGRRVYRIPIGMKYRIPIDL